MIAQHTLPSHRHRESVWMGAAAILILAYVGTMIALVHSASQAVFEPSLLLPILNTLFAGMLPIAVAVIAMRFYLSSGLNTILFMGCGMLVFGSGAILAGWLIGGQQGPNVNVTIYNVGALMGSIFHAVGAALAWRNGNPPVPTHRIKPNLIGMVAGVLLFMALLTVATLQGVMPTFFVQGLGPTPLRQVVLGTAAALFFASAMIFMYQFRAAKEPFHFWYTLSLLMLSLGLLAILMQKSVGSPLGWLSRSGHYIAGIFALVAVLNILKNARTSGIPVQRAVAELFRRYQLSYQVLVETITDPIVTLDQDLRVIQWNSSAEKVFGFQQNEAIGATVFALVIDPASADRIQQKIQELSAAASEHAYVGSPVEIEGKTKDGRSLLLEVSISGVLDRGQLLIVCVFRDMSAQRALEETVRNMAFNDLLTNLPNRRLLNDRLSQTMAASQRSTCYAALMFLDLDNFKPLNDVHGHGVGDSLLIEVAKRLTNCVREMDTVARFGGDEFVVLLRELHKSKVESTSQAQLVAENIRASLSEPYFLAVHQNGRPDSVIEHHGSASIGVAVFVNHEASQEDVLKWADDAMYQAKNAGRNSVQFHEEPKMQNMNDRNRAT